MNCQKSTTCCIFPRNPKPELRCLKKYVKLRDPEKLLEITRPITSKITQLRSSLSKEFESHLSMKHSFLMSLISFIGSTILQILFVFIYHRYKLEHSHTPLWCVLFCPKHTLVPGREERITRSASNTTISGENTLTHEFVKHASRQALNRSASYL